MPRPKRSRVAATRPAASTSATPEPAPAVTKPAESLVRPPSSDIYDVSDREKERMKLRAAGAAKKDAPQSRQTHAISHLEMNSEQAKALEDSRRRRDEAMERLDNLTSTSRPDHADSPAGIQPRLTDLSGLDLDGDSFGNLDDSLDLSEDAIEDTRDGYRSTDTSSFNIAMFRRRPRQSSVAGRDDAPIRPSSRGQNTPSISTTLNLGNFKRRAREPSILASARKPRMQRSRSQTSQASRNASVLGDRDGDDDSGPDGESTPLDRTRRQTRASLAANRSEEEGPPGSPSRKRKSLESHEGGREKRPALEATEADEIRESIEVDSEPASSPPRGRTRERERFSTPVQNDDNPDMAPPLSSSSSEGDSPDAWPSLDALAHRTYTRKPAPRALRTPEPGDDNSNISSPPSLTHSPNYTTVNTRAAAAAKKRAPAPPPQKKVTTADLTSLLPRRRHHKTSRRNTDSNDPFDLDGSDDGGGDRYNISVAGAEGEDELSYVDSRSSAAARRKKTSGQQRPLGRSTAANRKGKAATAAAGLRNGKKRNARTYGSMREDKENNNNTDDEAEEEIVVADGGSGDEVAELPGEEGEEEEEETSQMMAERLGEELQKAVKKFKEVDKWELSFEEVVECSSPGPDAR
ncbi:hypothetical protein VTK26DRAFT_7410 [Humicola hyalothermophila]